MPWPLLRPTWLQPSLDSCPPSPSSYGTHTSHSICRPSPPSAHQTRGPRPAQLQEIRRAKMPAFNTVYTVFSGIGIILSLIPLWWHVKSWKMHVGTCAYMIWTALGCLIHFVDSIMWNENIINWAPVWCDISTFRHTFTQISSHRLHSDTRIAVAVSVAVPACGLCIIRLLYNITVMTTPVLVGFWIILIFTNRSNLLTGTPSDGNRPVDRSWNPRAADGCG